VYAKIEERQTLQHNPIDGFGTMWLVEYSQFAEISLTTTTSGASYFKNFSVNNNGKWRVAISWDKMVSKTGSSSGSDYDYLYMTDDLPHPVDVDLLIYKPNGSRYRVSCSTYNNSELVIIDPNGVYGTYKMQIVAWSTSNYQNSVIQEIGLAWW